MLLILFFCNYHFLLVNLLSFIIIIIINIKNYIKENLIFSLFSFLKFKNKNFCFIKKYDIMQIFHIFLQKNFIKNYMIEKMDNTKYRKKHNMKRIILLIFMMIFLPYVIVTLFIEEKEIKFYFKDEKEIRVKKEDNKIINVPFEEYIVGVVSGEMPINFELEALKAQAVAARSYAYIKMNENKENDYDVVDTIMNQVYLDEKTLKEKWKNDYIKNINKVKTAILETKGEYMDYHGEIVEALFFSTSTGKTENVEEVFSENLPYLRSVDSSFDEEISPVFNDQKSFTLKDFYQKLSLRYQDKLNINVLETTSTGRIKKILINNKVFSGNEVANFLSLRSSYFSIEQKDNQIIVHTKGFGHGVGMSQYGAEALAKKGYHYQDILKHYYTDIEIKRK